MIGKHEEEAKACCSDQKCPTNYSINQCGALSLSFFIHRTSNHFSRPHQSSHALFGDTFFWCRAMRHH